MSPNSTGMGWTSLISKMFNWVIVILIFLMEGCSTSTYESITEGKTIIKKTVAPPLITGPTKTPKNSPFRDKTSQYGLEGVRATNLYAVDFNGDTWTDLVVLPDHYSIPEFYQYNPKKKKFIKIEENLFPEVIKGSFLNFADFNKDGLMDVLVGTLNRKTELTQYPLRIFKGNLINGRFSYSEVSGSFPKGIFPVTSAILLDYDLDGQLDVFQGNWFNFKIKRPTPLRDMILKGGGFKFKNVSYLLKGENQWRKYSDSYINARPTFGVSTCDIDQNGLPDILTASSSGYSNKLWLNLYDEKNKDRIYIDYGRESGFSSDKDGELDPLGGGNSFFANCGDFNSDGIMDLILGELNHSYAPEKRDRSSILIGSSWFFPP